MLTDPTTTTEATRVSARSPQAPPPPVPPPDLVRLRVDVDGEDYRRLRHIGIETATSVNEMVCEAIRMLLRYYCSAGLPAGHVEGRKPFKPDFRGKPSASRRVEDRRRALRAAPPSSSLGKSDAERPDA